ncbi:MAG: acyl-CoA synthetase FdrA [Chloroflexota bacterium]
MPIGGLLKPRLYRDSVALMQLSTRLSAADGVRQASVMMGTAANLEILAATGLMTEQLASSGPNDLCIAVDAADDGALARALGLANQFLERSERPPGPSGAFGNDAAPPRTLAAAHEITPEANLALISIPGEYAAMEARAALRRGLNVFLFSDNVPLEEEVALKRLATERGLLVMGPDCGTAIIHGVPLGFANVVRRGSIGIVAASGTGLQEVSCLIDRLGAGVSHAIGTGSRDLSAEVGGATTLAALDLLAGDPATRVVALVAKPGDPETQSLVVARLGQIGKPAVAYFLGGGENGQPSPPNVVAATSLEHAARAAVALNAGQPAPGSPPGHTTEAHRILRQITARQRFVRGLFAGGTLAQEAADAIRRAVTSIPDQATSHHGGLLLDLAGHQILDLGDDAFTRGRPHPLIDPRIRNERLVQEAASGDVALILLDVILGYGSPADPAGGLLPALRSARDAAAAAGSALHVVASLTGTAADPQGYADQRARLEAAGVFVAESSTQAAAMAAVVARGLMERGS